VALILCVDDLEALASPDRVAVAVTDADLETDCETESENDGDSLAVGSALGDFDRDGLWVPDTVALMSLVSDQDIVGDNVKVNLREYVIRFERVSLKGVFVMPIEREFVILGV